MSFRIGLGGYWLQEPNGWGQFACATKYPTLAAATKAASKIPNSRIVHDAEHQTDLFAGK